MKVLIFYFLLIIPMGQLAFSQNVISGTVTDSNSQPLPGATILVANTKTGTTTDFDGRFSIEAKQGSVLEVSYIGFQKANITIGSSKTYKIALQEDSALLDEVVVVGYGTQKKVNLTGAIEMVTFKDEVNQPVTNAGQLLYGRFSGVQLTQSSGSPGADGSSITIRGVGTFGNSTPLVVIDNIQYDDLSAFNSLAPADIETISVLKDAAALSIYGARAANGVILVTTRRGDADKFEISYNSYYGVQDVTVRAKFLGALDYANLMNEKFRNSDGPGFIPRYTPAQIEAIRTGALPNQFTDTNWSDAVLKQASIQNHNLSFTGGSEKTTYRLSLGYLGQDAIVKSKFKSERYNLSFNINSKLKEWFTISSVTNAFWRHNEGPTGGQDAFNGDNGIIYQLQRTAPTIPLFYSNGDYGVVDGAWLNSNPSFPTVNPLRRGFLGNYESDVINVSQRIGATIQLAKNLTFETSGSANLIYNNTSDFIPTDTTLDYNGQIVPQTTILVNNLDNSTNFEYTLLNENILRFNKSFNDTHNFGALLGYSTIYLKSDGFRGTLSGFPTNNLEEFNAGGLVNPAVFGGANETTTQSVFGRIDYNYKETYFAEFNLRRDGSSKFGPQNVYGTFPAASVGWRISKEKFMENLDFISNLKLRASWGITGNDRAIKNDENIWEQTYSPDQDYVLGNPGIDVVGVAITSLANPTIRWEESEQLDLGLDVSMFNNKVEFAAGYFNKNSKDILYDNFPVPSTLGVSNLGAQNAAEMINRGLEFNLNYRGTIGDAKFSVGGNMTKFLKAAEVTGLGDGGEETINANNITRIGEPFRAYYGWQAIGIFQDLNEIANSPTQFGNANTAPGDLKYADISGPNGIPDGIVDGADRKVIGNPNPDILVNFNGSIEYKGFDLNLLFQGVSGVDRLLQGNGNLPMADDRSNVLTYWLNRWTPENPGVNLPRVGGINNTIVSTFYVQDVSYLRLKSIEFGYSLPKDVLQKINISKLRVFVGGQNLFTFTGLENFDPEGGSGAQSNRNPPLYKTITFGLNLKL
ncbi:SusC/RagA family TonB-linked outer membrane protein [Mariniflexile sp.]|uniref:SusC/RagA family TonB-linked outer membrane protein n=1 Tax=Mariniflexile sp. TaxID=1979402 RepID=UPI004048C928